MWVNAAMLRMRTRIRDYLDIFGIVRELLVRVGESGGEWGEKYGEMTLEIRWYGLPCLNANDLVGLDCGGLKGRGALVIAVIMICECVIDDGDLMGGWWRIGDDDCGRRSDDEIKDFQRKNLEKFTSGISLFYFENKINLAPT